MIERDHAIKTILSVLPSYNIDLSSMDALEFFAREGDWQTVHYAPLVKSLSAWEIDPKFEENLRKNLPKADITIGDSFELAKNNIERFDFIVLDNPQGCFGPNNEYCEHFDALPLALKMMKKSGGVLIFNLKTNPFDYDDKLEWQRRRNEFYSVSDSSNLTEHFSVSFYLNYFESLGRECMFTFLVQRPQEQGLFAFVIGLKGKNEPC